MIRSVTNVKGSLFANSPDTFNNNARVAFEVLLVVFARHLFCLHCEKKTTVCVGVRQGLFTFHLCNRDFSHSIAKGKFTTSFQKVPIKNSKTVAQLFCWYCRVFTEKKSGVFVTFDFFLKGLPSTSLDHILTCSGMIIKERPHEIT